jgi:hypothetical protein
MHYTTPHHLKAGDLVAFHGAVFEIIENARESNSHRPQAAHIVTAHGPCDVAKAIGRWVRGGSIPGYFGPGTNWTFQGNHKRRVAVIN